MYLQTHHMSIYLGSSNPPSFLFYLLKVIKSPQIHDLSILIFQRRWTALKSITLIPPRSCRSLISTTYPFKTIQSSWVYVPSNPPHVHLSWVFKSTICPFWSLKGDEEPSNPPSWSLEGDEEPSNPPFWYFQGAVEPSNPPPVHLKLFKVLGSMYLHTHHMSIYLGSSNLPSLLFDLSKEMKSPQIHHLIYQRRWRALKSTILIPPRSCKALKSTTCPFKTIQSAWVYVPSYPWSVHFDLSKEMKSPQIHRCDTSKEP